MAFEIVQAKRELRKLKISLAGASGSGKTYTGLSLGKAIGKKMLVLDTENRSSTLYAGDFDFDVIHLPKTDVQEMIEFLESDVPLKYDVVMIDSMTHYWQDILEEKEQHDQRGGNSYTNWGKITPKFNRFVRAIVNLETNLIVCLRAKTEYVLETNEKGKQVPRRVGMAAQFRDGFEYEFDIHGVMDLDHNLIIEKSRYKELADKVFNKPTGKLIAEIQKKSAELEKEVKTEKKLEAKREESKKIKAETPPELKPEQITDSFLKDIALEDTPMIGKFKGQKLKDIPLDYLEELRTGKHSESFKKLAPTLHKRVVGYLESIEQSEAAGWPEQDA